MVTSRRDSIRSRGVASSSVTENSTGQHEHWSAALRALGRRLRLPVYDLSILEVNQVEWLVVDWA